MSNPFGGFASVSPLCSIKSPNVQPLVHLVSANIRDYFGPTVQTVADVLIAEATCHLGSGGGGGAAAGEGGGYTFAFLLSKIKSMCGKTINQGRKELLKHIPGIFYMEETRGPETSGYVVQPDAVRAALVVLIQHSIVIPTLVRHPPGPGNEPMTSIGKENASKMGGDGTTKTKKPVDVYRYHFDIDRARYMVRYPKYIEYTSKAVGDDAATIVEELLIRGRMLTEDILYMAVEHAKEIYLMKKEEEYEAETEDAQGSGDNTKSNGSKKRPAPVETTKIKEEGANGNTSTPSAMNHKKIKLETTKEGGEHVTFAAQTEEIMNVDENENDAVADGGEYNEEQLLDEDDDNKAQITLTEDELMSLRQNVLDSFKKLIDGGYVESVNALQTMEDVLEEEEAETKETEFNDKQQQPSPSKTTETKKKRQYEDIHILPPLKNNHRTKSTGTTRSTSTSSAKSDGSGTNDINSSSFWLSKELTPSDDPPVVDDDAIDGGDVDAPERIVLKQMIHDNGVLRSTLVEGNVWRVNVHMFHSVLRAFCLGRLVAERYGDKIPSCGSIVSAALKFTAYQRYSPLAPTHRMSEQERMETIGLFTPGDILDMLPRTVQDHFKTKAGGATANLSASLVKMANVCTWPQVMLEVEDAQGHPLGGKFEVATKQIADHLQRRVLHQVLKDQHDEYAARVVSILEVKGYLDVDSVADATMIPVAEVREVLHRLSRSRYITMYNFQQSGGAKFHNPGTATYLWGIDKVRTFQTLQDQITLALTNIRLRRRHELELGKDYVERAKQDPSTMDENEHAQDKANYQRFCKGLDRLDQAALQLDETLMVMIDFARW